MTSSRPSDEDDGNEETVGLLTSTDHDSSAPPRSTNNKEIRMKRAQLQKASRLRPLEVLHSSAHRRLEDQRAAARACQSGFAIFFLSVIIGLWIWSGQQVNQHTSIQRWHNLRLSDIQHWCLDKSNDCICSNPLEPEDRIAHSTWQQAHDGNIRDAISGSQNAVDVVFLGDSITEGWRGMSLGQLHPEKVNNIKVYESLFDKSQGADFQGLALGIAGDKTFNLLWRIQNGEVPDSLHPSVWWLLIGTNDFQRKDPHCSPEVVVLGVKRVIEELRRLRPGSTIVLNSLLPRSDSDDGTLVDAEHPKHLTVWQGILEVNKELRDYCQIFRNLYYFDATSIFIRQKNNTAKGINAEFIPNELMYDYLHPTAEGYRLWGEKIVSTLHELMDASHVSKRLPLSSLWWTRTTSTNASFLREPSS